MQTITVALGERSYPIEIGAGIIDSLPGTLDRIGAGRTVGLVTDSNVGPLYADRVTSLLADAGRRVVASVLPAGEVNKKLSQIESLCGDFLAGGLDRSSLVVALGGGVVGDVAGFAAACFMRGVPFVQLPTTIVAQVDSSVGGKTGVNHPLGKNIIGAFHQPLAVLIDLDMLKTLPDRELRAGLAEAIKHGVIADEELFSYMESEAGAILEKDLAALEYPIRRSCEIKAAVVAEDEREQGHRAILNYGHTFAHGFESATGYTGFLHGEAVALGMHAAGVLAEKLGMVDRDFVERQRKCISGYGLPVSWDELPVDKVLAAMRHDKKVRSGKMKLILASGFGYVVQRTDVTEPQLAEVLRKLRNDE